MNKISCFLNYWVFIMTTITIGSLIYEAYELKWFSIVGILILLMDGSFIVATLANIMVARRSRWLLVHVFSLMLILVAVAMKLVKIDYPTITLVLWCLYIWFVYGISIVRQYVGGSSE